MTKAIAVALAVAFVGSAWLSLPPPPRPQVEGRGGHAGHGGGPAGPVEGVVLAVDRSANNITLGHGAIPNLGMGPMSMGFQAADPAMLERIRAGDKVRFEADVVGSRFTVTKIERTE